VWSPVGRVFLPLGTYNVTGRSILRRWYERHYHLILTYGPGLVPYSMCHADADPHLGYDWSLDRQDWVRSSSFLFPSSVNQCILCRFHNAWEFWVYSVVYGLVVGPNYSIAQTLMGELTPPGFEYMFFGLFGLSNRSASIIGPNVIQAIISKSGNNWKAFPFLFVLSALGCLVAWIGINVPKGRHAAAQWAAEKRETGVGTGFLDEKAHEESSESRSEGKSVGKTRSDGKI
jgi:MFS family permease